MIGLHLDDVGTERIRSDSNGLADLAAGNLHLPVATCGDWTMADLVWHLVEVQDFWIYVITNRPDGPKQYVRPSRPADEDLADGLRNAVADLTSSLDAADPAEEAWSWASDHTVGFTIRRQTHEALVHYVDGCMAVGANLPATPPPLAADGVEEVLDVMLSSEPGTTGLALSDDIIELRSTDTGDRWLLGFGELHGSDGAALSTLVPVTDRVATAIVSAPALELNLWIWGRLGIEAVEVDGDASLPTRLRELVINLG